MVNNKATITSVEPKRCNRWLVTLPEEFNLEPQIAFKTSRPSAKILNGDVIPNPISITFRDPIAPSYAQLVFIAMVGLTDYDSDSDNSQAKVHKSKFSNLKDGFNYTLELLDPTNTVVEKWEILGCTLTGVDFGGLSYSDDSLCEVTITVQPKKWVLLY